MPDINQYLEISHFLPLLVLGSFAVAFLITYIAIPSIVSVAQAKNLYDMPNVRGSHSKPTPVLGGTSVFAGMVISTILFTDIGFESDLKYIISALIALFFIGIKDDIILLTQPWLKFVIQIVAALLIILLGDVRIIHFHGFLGLESVSYILSISYSVLFFILLTNAFNWIDGIDGLASGIGIMASITFGTWFTLSGYDSYAIMSFALAGGLCAFFYFNVFSKKNKIFLGDTGSLILGFSLAVFAIKFMQFGVETSGNLRIESAPAVAISILFIPLFDMLRVITIRLLQRRSPFIGDKQHIHHRLLDFGFSHLKATVIILCFNTILIALPLSLQQLRSSLLIFIELAIASLLSFIMMSLLRKKYRKEHPGKPLEDHPYPYPHPLVMEYRKRVRRESIPSKEVNCPLDYDCPLNRN